MHPNRLVWGCEMPLEVDMKNFEHVTLKCSKCRNSIKVLVASRGTSKISDAIDKVDKEARKRKWTRDPDVCPKH